MSSKRNILTMQQRLDILKDLEMSNTITVARKYNVHSTTIQRIRRNSAIVISFAEKDKKEKRRQRIRRPQYEELEKRLFLWFMEKKTIGDVVTDQLLLNKAAELKEEIGACSNFKMSAGWLSKFKQRNEIRLVRGQGEKISFDEEIEVKDEGQGMEEVGNGEQRKEETTKERGMAYIKHEEGYVPVKQEGNGETNEEKKKETAQGHQITYIEYVDLKEEITCEENNREDYDMIEEEKEVRMEERGIARTEEEREDLEDIFKRLGRYDARVLHSTKLMVGAIKILYLGKPTTKIDRAIIDEH